MMLRIKTHTLALISLFFFSCLYFFPFVFHLNH